MVVVEPCGRLWCSGHWWHVVDQLKEVVVVVMVWVVIGLSYVVDVGDVVDEVEVSGCVGCVWTWDCVGCVAWKWMLLWMLGTVKRSGRLYWKMCLYWKWLHVVGLRWMWCGKWITMWELDDLVELVAVLGMAVVEHVMGMETSVVVWLWLLL